MKPVTEFYAVMDTKRGYRYWCKECIKRYVREWKERKKMEEYGKLFSITGGKYICRNCGAAFIHRTRAKKHYLMVHAK